MAENKTKREAEHKQEYDHGEIVAPYGVIPDDAGWTVCPKNKGKYDGKNSDWRE